MNPIYKFEIETIQGGETTAVVVHPLCKNDIAKEYEKEQNQQFFRAKLNGKFKFVGPDFDYIDQKSFETKFVVVVYISWNAGQTWNEYWRGHFYKTDCTFDYDNKVIDVSPSVDDQYTNILAGLENEYNLIDLLPETRRIMAVKRPLIQIYVAGENVVSCIIPGASWEQDCEVIENDAELTGTYHFALNRAVRYVTITGELTPDATGVYGGTKPAEYGTYNYVNGDFTFAFVKTGVGQTAQYTWFISRNNVIMWRYDITTGTPPQETGEITLQAVSGTGATGTVTAYIADVKVYARYLCDTAKVFMPDATYNTYALPSNDMVSNNRNYHRAFGYVQPGVIEFESATSTTPTKYGIKQPGEYYIKPDEPLRVKWFPIGRNHWGETSIWYKQRPDSLYENKAGWDRYTLNDATPLASAISVILSQIAPGITHQATAEYSALLYGSSPLGIDYNLYLTAKSNILAGEYTQPAQKAMIKLATITGFLRDCFCAYWYIEDGKFKIEHISWFKNGGRYTGTPDISHDLTVERVTRNGKAWAFGSNQIEYDKPTMPERYQFGWMDDVSEFFEGSPIEIVSEFVNRGNIEETNVENITTDVDYMLINPGAMSQDGFALLAAKNGIDIKDLQFEQGRINAGRDKYENLLENDSTIVRTGLMPIVDNIATLSIKTGYQVRISMYDADGVQTHRGNFGSDLHRYANWDAYCTIEVKRTDGTQITPQEVKFDVSVTGEISGMAEHIVFSNHYVNGILTESQNGNLAFSELLPAFHLSDMPAKSVKIAGQSYTAQVQRNKQQNVRFPVGDDPDPMELIKTDVGNGQVQKLSINLSSRNANVALRYDTY